jgi:hypothetical protein
MLLSYRRRYCFIHIPKTAGQSIKAALQRAIPDSVSTDTMHATAFAVRERLGPQWDEFYTFAFVRNPFTWLVSLFHFGMMNGQIRRSPTFASYLTDPANEHKNQVDYICAKGAPIVSFVGRFEHLPSDFAKVCEHLHIHPPLPHMNAAPRPVDYRSYYNADLRQFVFDRYVRDFATFQYEFEP